MASYRKRGDTWRAEIVKSGIRESKSFGTKREAQEWAAKRESEIASVSMAGITPKPLRDVLERYRDEVADANKGSRWESLRINKFLRDEPELAAKMIHHVTAADLAAWRDKRLKLVKPASVRREIALIRSAWRYARKEWGNVKENPWLDIHIPAKGKNRQKIYTQDQIDRLALALGYEQGKPIKDKCRHGRCISAGHRDRYAIRGDPQPTVGGRQSAGASRTPPRNQERRFPRCAVVIPRGGAIARNGGNRPSGGVHTYRWPAGHLLSPG